MKLEIRLREWTDATRTPTTRHPEVHISGDPAGLRQLRQAVDFALNGSPGVHTHFLDGDEPGIQTSPPRIMLTIEHDDRAGDNGSAVHSAS
jgi:hypothetical protein